MADSWGEWLGGDPARRARDLQATGEEFGKVRASPQYQALRGLSVMNFPDRQVDPRAVRMQMAQDALANPRSSDAWDAEAAAANYLFDMGGRVRDTALKAVHSASDGDLLGAAALSARAPVAALYPPAGAGMRGQPDDWREGAIKSGAHPGWVTAIDLATDPEMYVAAPLKGAAAFMAPALPMMAGKAALSRTDDILRALNRYAPPRAAYAP